MQPKLIAAIILVALLAACAPNQPVEVPTPVQASPTATTAPTSTPVPDTATPTPSPVPTATATLTAQELLERSCFTLKPSIQEGTSLPPLVLTSRQGITVLDAVSGSSVREIKGFSRFASVSPDGKWIAHSQCASEFGSCGEFVLTSADGKKNIHVPLRQSEVIFERLFWLDNEHVWMTLYPAPGKVAGTVILNPFTGERVSLASDYPEIFRYDDGSTGMGLHFGYSSVIYSPSLDLVIYPQRAEDWDYTVLWDRKAGKEVVRIADATFKILPIWVPADNSFLVAGRNSPEIKQREWFLLNQNGEVRQISKLRDLLGDYRLAYNPSTSPDGRFLAFGINMPKGIDYDRESMKYLILDTQTGEVTSPCIPMPLLDEANWTPDGRYFAIGSWESDESSVYVLDIQDRWMVKVMDGEKLTARGWLENGGSVATPTPQTAVKMTPSQFQQYLGIKTDPLPEGFKTVGSGVFLNDERYQLELVRKDTDLMLWLENGKVLDILDLQDFKNDEAIYAFGCKINGVEDPEIVAVGAFTREVWRTRYATNETIRRAYRANLGDGSFSSILTTGIECSAELGFDPNNLTNATNP